MVSAYCPKCGSPLSPGAPFCANCGAAVTSAQFGSAHGGGLVAPAYAGFGSRLGALILDGLLLAVPGVILAIVILASVFSSIDFATFDGTFTGDVQRDLQRRVIAAQLLGATLALAYYTLTIGISGQTIGGRIVGIRVIRTDGRSLTMSGALIRALVGVGLYNALSIMGGFVPAVSFLSFILFLLGYLWMLWDSQKQTWHDKAASSIVVRSN